MDTSDLIDAEFWRSSLCRVMVNERDASAAAEARMMSAWVKNQPELEGHLLFATSGSSGARKWVALSKHALLASARVVNNHLAVDSSDRWLLALPTFHVGGMGILARCHEASCEAISYHGKWDAASYQALCRDQRITLSSMVPTQLVDLVSLGLPSPPALRSVLIGGGQLDDATYQKASALGWPVIETYGMTETSSQVATARVGARELELLPSWQAKTDDSGRLMLHGVSALTGYVHCKNGGVSMVDPKQDGWWVASDLVELSGRVLRVKGRVDRGVKILGELVSLDEVQREWVEFITSEGSSFVVVAVDDPRKGAKLILCVEGAVEVLSDDLSAFNAQCHPLHRLDVVQRIDAFPRTPLGKIRYQEIGRR